MSKEADESINTGSSIASRLLNSRVIKSIIAGFVITFITLIVSGFNLSTNSGIPINDDINRYFDTCVGQAFISTTPRIRTDERGFPLSYVQTSHVPICDNNVEIKRSSSTYFEAGAFFANVLFWSCTTFLVLRSYVRRRHLKVTRSA